MNKLLKIGVFGMAALSYLGVGAQQINPMTEAVLRDYADILAENPKDYLTLYDRASLYYEIGEYARALSDIDMALEYTPETETDYRIAEYSLQADILTVQKKYSEALDAVKKALALNPVSAPELYKSGNLNLLLNKPEDALSAFQALQRENPRSQEAFYGMAKAYAMMGNVQDAERMIEEIGNLGKQSFVTYCRIGDLYSDMGNIAEATTNYAIAFTMEEKNSRPVESLKLLAHKYPDQVMQALDNTIASNQDNLLLNYLKAMLAFDGGMYAQAERACKDLAGSMEEESAAVYRMMAMAQLAQNNMAEANQSIAVAEKLAPDDAGVFLDKAEILMSQNPEQAFLAAKSALGNNRHDEAAMLTAAKAAILAKNYDEAKNLLGEIILTNPSNAEALLIRGYLLSEFMDDGKSGVSDFTRAGNITQNPTVKDMVYAAMGKSFTNKKLDADGLINDAISKAGKDKDALYLIAVYYAQTGNLEKAKEYVDRAMLNGYSNMYNLKANPQPLLNLAPIRHLM